MIRLLLAYCISIYFCLVSSLAVSSEPLSPVVLDYGRPLVSRTARFYETVGNGKHWKTKKIDWKDFSGDDSYKKINEKFSTRRNDFTEYGKYVERYRKSPTRHHALEMGIACLAVLNPGTRFVQTYTYATADPDFAATEFSILKEALGNDISWREAEVLFLLEVRCGYNPEMSIKVYDDFVAHNRTNDMMTLRLAGKIFSAYEFDRKLPKSVTRFYDVVQSIHSKRPSQGSHMILSSALMVRALISKDVSEFDRGWKIKRDIFSQLARSGDKYDREAARKEDYRQKEIRDWRKRNFGA